MGGDLNALTGQNLQTDAAGDAQGRCQPAGEMSAAPHVLKAAVFHLGRVVRVGGPGRLLQKCIVLGAGVGVFNNRRQRRAAGDILHQPAEDLHLVGLPPGRGNSASAGGTALHKAPKLLPVHPLSGGQPVNADADGLRVGLAKDGYFDFIPPGRGHQSHLPVLCIPARNPGRISGHIPRPAKPSPRPLRGWRPRRTSWRSGGRCSSR